MRKAAIAIGILIVLVIGMVGMYNSLVRKDVVVSTAWAQVENVLQRRADLIPNLVASVKGYVKHERGVLNDLANARNGHCARRGNTVIVRRRLQAMSAQQLAGLSAAIGKPPALPRLFTQSVSARKISRRLANGAHDSDSILCREFGDNAREWREY